MAHGYEVSSDGLVIWVRDVGKGSAAPYGKWAARPIDIKASLRRLGNRPDFKRKAQQKLTSSEGDHMATANLADKDRARVVRGQLSRMSAKNRNVLIRRLA